MTHVSSPTLFPVPGSRPAPNLERSYCSWRFAVNLFLSILAGVATAIAMAPLLSVLAMLVVRGSSRLGLELLTALPPSPGDAHGGIGNCLLGTLVMVGIGSAISVPVGILGAIYLAEFGRNSRSADFIRFSAKVLTGLPSILAGVFGFALLVMTLGRPSALAGGFALAILMLPTILLTAEEAIRQVPARIREAAIGIGATPTQMVWHILLPAALPNILTGVLLAVARAAGETAPLLWTAQFSYYWMGGKMLEPTASLSVLIYNFSQVPESGPFKIQADLAWSASLVLVVIVLLTNLAGRRLAHWSTRK